MAANTNYSYSSGIKPTLLETYLTRRALKNVEPNLGYIKDAQMIEQPLNSGSKHVTFFRYTELPAITKPLYEGVTPDGQSLSETAFSVMTKNYGGWMSYTDEIDLWHVDKKTDAMSDRLNRQAELTLDTVGRDAICAGLNVMYPADVTARASLNQSTATHKISYDLIKKAVRNLKMKGAQPFEDGYYHAKIDHETYYDLTNDTHWDDANKYQDKSREEKYLLGTIYNVKFYAVDNGKTFKDETYLIGTTTSFDVPSGATYDRDNRELTVTATLTEDQARELTGKMVYVAYTNSTTNDTKTLMCIEKVTPGTSTAKIKFRWQPASSVTDKWVYTTYAACVLPSGGGASSTVVHASIIYGKDAFGCVKLGGAGKPNIQIIVKPLGSEGANDPLNQRGSIAWKVPFFCCAVLQDDFIVRLEHTVSA